jgi:neutral trehalase
MSSLNLSGSQPSFFAQMVDQLRNKSEAELKLLYTRFFQKELKEEWKSITKKADFKKASESDIIKAIQKSRYQS